MEMFPGNVVSPIQSECPDLPNCEKVESIFRLAQDLFAKYCPAKYWKSWFPRPPKRINLIVLLFLVCNVGINL
jgi:hypothetical protein